MEVNDTVELCKPVRVAHVVGRTVLPVGTKAVIVAKRKNQIQDREMILVRLDNGDTAYVWPEEIVAASIDTTAKAA